MFIDRSSRALIARPHLASRKIRDSRREREIDRCEGLFISAHRFSDLSGSDTPRGEGPSYFSLSRNRTGLISLADLLSVEVGRAFPSEMEFEFA